jgi:hypothetical protein
MAMEKYSLLIGYQNEEKYRAAFNYLAIKTFNLSFEKWYQSGYWREKYIPYTLFDGERAIANVSVNIMDFNVLGQQQRYIQLGTIMTDEDYRKNNLSQFLMEKVLEEWSTKCQFIYLYANGTVLDIYPKFGFCAVKEYAYSKQVEKKKELGDFEKLNMDLSSSRELLYEYAKNTQVFGKISMKENADLVMFYCITVMSENVYYSKSVDIIVVAEFNDYQLHLLDVFGKVNCKLDLIIDFLIDEQDEVLLGFTPEDPSTYETREIAGDDILFIQKDKTKLFDVNKIMFPLLSHA